MWNVPVWERIKFKKPRKSKLPHYSKTLVFAPAGGAALGGDGAPGVHAGLTFRFSTQTEHLCNHLKVRTLAAGSVGAGVCRSELFERNQPVQAALCKAADILMAETSLGQVTEATSVARMSCQRL